MNFPVKWFSSEMPGAPVLNGHPGAVISVLDACLLNGWGLVSVDSLTYDAVTDEATLSVAAGHVFVKEQVIFISGANEPEFNGEQRVLWLDSTTVKFKPVHTPAVAAASGDITAKVAPAGSWEKVFTSGDGFKAAYRSTSHKRRSSVYLRVDDSNTATTPTSWSYSGVHAIVEAYEEMSDIDTFSGLVNTGMHDRSFRKAYSTTAAYMDYENQWQIISDELFVYVFSNSTTQWRRDAFNCMYFGELVSYKPDDDYCYAIQAHYQAAQGSYTYSDVARMNSAYYRYLQRDYSGLKVGQPYAHKGMTIVSNQMGYGQLANNPNPVDNGLHYTDKVFITEVPTVTSTSHIMRGELPGLGYPLHDKPINHGSVIELSWRGSTRKIFASYSAAGNNLSYNSDSSHGQMFFDIEGSWRP